MTTTPVHSITDEQIADSERLMAELERVAGNLPSVRALITRLREAEKDAARYRFLRSDESKGEVDLCITKVYWAEGDHYVVLVNESADWAIDTAMQGDK